MKKVILAAAALFVLSTTVFAQEAQPTKKQNGKGAAHPKKEQGMQKQTPEQRAQKSVDQLDKAVTLTAEQKPKIYELALTRAKSVDAIREKYKGQKEMHKEMGAEIQEVRKTFRKEAKGVLTPEQLEKAKSVAKENKANKGKKGAEEAHDALDTQD